MQILVLGDRILHVMTALLSALLLLVSYRAYSSRRNTKFLYIGLAFGFFFIKENLLLFQSFAGQRWELSFSAHVLNLVILATFFKGIIE